MAHYQNEAGPPGPIGEAGKEHLQYLLTAYLFGNISAAGRREVEEHLAGCAACRMALEELRRTLALVEAAVEADRREYVFDERRRARVLVAARNARHDWLGRLSPFAVPRFSWRLGAVAAVLLVVLVGGLFLSLLGGKSASRAYTRDRLRPATKTAESKSEVVEHFVEAADEAQTAGITLRRTAEADVRRLDEAKPAQKEDVKAAGGAGFFSVSKSERKDRTGTAGVVRKRVDEPKPADPTSTVAPGVTVPKDILEKAELGDHFESANPDRPETRSAPEKQIIRGKELAQGRDKGLELAFEEAGGAGAGATPGTGEGWGGGAGRGVAQKKTGGAERSRVLVHGGARTPSKEAQPQPAPKLPQRESQNHAQSPQDEQEDRMANQQLAEQVDELRARNTKLATETGKQIEALEEGAQALEKAADSTVRDHRVFACPSSGKEADWKALRQDVKKETAPVALTTIGVYVTGNVPNNYGPNAPEEKLSPYQDPGKTGKENLADLEVSVNELRDRKLTLQAGDVLEVADGKTSSAAKPFRWQFTGEKERQAAGKGKVTVGGLVQVWKDTTVGQGDANHEGEGPKGPGLSGNDATMKSLAREGEKDSFLAAFQGDTDTTKNGREQAKMQTSTRHELEIYDVRDLTKVINEFPAPRTEIPGAKTEAPPAATDKDVIQRLRERLSPADFADAQASIEEQGGKLVIMNRPEVQEKVRKALEEMRREGAAKSGEDRVAQRGEAASDIELRIYDVSDLTPVIQDMPGPLLEPRQGKEPEKKLGPTAQDLAQRIREHLAPSDLAAAGTSIEERSGKLAIMQRPEVHAKIDRALRQLRQTEVANDEQSLRAFRYFHAENGKLAYPEFVRRPLPVPAPELTDEGMDEDAFIERYGYRPFVDAARDHLSTFGMDVDTASYTQARAALREGRLPEPESVRTEEFVNYFKQPYEVAGDETFGVYAEGMPSPFGCAAGLDLVKIGIKSRAPRPDERKPAALTFAVDLSGSMGREDAHGLSRLDLLREALRGMVASLAPEDSVCIVGFNEQAQVVLPRTEARFASRILDALNRLGAGGGTNLEAGLALGYRLADEAFSPEAVNRVVLCSDGVANVGQQGPEELLKLVQIFAARGIDLAAVGLGLGQYNDPMMAKLADSGNGSAHFVDTPQEAEKVFREQLPPHLDALARDAKVQVDFDPAVVARYRLLGYEKRKIADKDFRNDKIDAGEVGHATLVTALYEIERRPNANGPLGRIYLRWKDASRRHLPVVERNYPLGEGLIAARAETASADLRFLACVAQFAELLRGSPWARTGSFAGVLGQLDRLSDECRSRAEWHEVTELVRRAQGLSVQHWAEEARTQDKK